MFRPSVGVVLDILRVRGDVEHRPLVHYAVCVRGARTTRFRLFWVRCHNFSSPLPRSSRGLLLYIQSSANTKNTTRRRIVACILPFFQL